MKKVPFSPPDITESEVNLVSEALRSGWITTGPKTKEFERLIAMCCQTEQAVCLNSATACMELILRVLDVGPGDEVITSAYTYTATASVTCHVGAKVVMVDTAPDSFEMDYDKLADAITEKTKVVLPVDLAGVVCDYDKIFAAVESKKHLFSPANDIQKAYGRVIVLADAAHAFGAKWHGKMCGEIADFTSFSFHAVKNLTTAEGGALTWRNHDGVDNESLYKQFQLLSLHGQNKDALAKTRLGAWEYDIVAPYYKCNMTDVMAGIGLAQLKRYPEMLYRRRQIIERYNEGLKGRNVQVLDHFGDDHSSSGHLYLVRLLGEDVEYRNAVIERMAERGIACNVHYKPLPMMTAYKNLGFDSFTPIECMSPPERTPVGWAKDSVLIDEICNILISTDNSDLIFGISIQGHGGYPSDYIEDKEVYITNDYSKDNKNSLEYYINQIYEMDQFIGNLIEAVNELNEPTIIVFYGDHFPAIGLSESNISIRTLKKTPYLIWDNINLSMENKDISAYELTSLILDKLSLPSTTLNMLHNSSLDEKTKTEYLNQLEYDMIYGKNYTADYEELVPSSEYKIGFKNVKINSIEIYDDNNILIKGENFNNYSNVYINGKYIEKISIDNNTLSIPLNYCKKGDKIQIRQDSTTDSTIFSYSNELTFK